MPDTAPPTSGVLVLGPGVELVPVRDLPQDLRERLGGAESDFVLSDRTVRANSQRVDATTANLLAQFAKPRRIAEAVVAHSVDLELEPARVLELAYPLISTLRSQGVLVDAAAAARHWAGPAMSPGDEFGQYRIIRLVSDLADTEVYEMADAEGMRFALKRLRPGAPALTRATLRREAVVLGKLAGRGCRVVPRLHEAHLDGASAHVVMDWCEGERLLDMTGATTHDLAHRAEAVRVLLEAYVDLHGRGVLHGDVHPANVIVGPDGAIRVVDFGGAVLDGAPPGPRIGTVPFYEPEVARALLTGEEAPPPTASGEQYALAAVAYAVLVQAPYLLISLETDRALRQIVDDPPRPFGEAGLHWPAVEGVLAQALAKSPQDRHPTLERFAAALADATRTPAQDRRRAAPGRVRPRPPRAALLERAVASAVDEHGLSAPLTATGLAGSPTASLYAGGGGIAYMLARLACLRDDPALLAAADVWIGHALRERTRSLAFRDGSVGHGSVPGRLALLHSETGLRVVEALVRHASSDEREAQDAIDEFVRAARGADAAGPQAAFAGHELDATNGAASLLMGAAMLLPLSADDASLRALGSELAARVLEELRGPGENRLLGFAHGRSGALHALLRWAQASRVAPSPAVEAELESLAELARERGGGLAWPVEAGVDAAPWTGWCHGSAGHVLTWTAAAAALERPELLELAEGAGRHVWSARSHSGPSLCCGAAGEGVALLVLARAGDDAGWRDRGRRLIATAVEQSPALAHEQGLFRSRLGAALAAAEALEPAEAVWPLCGLAL